MDGFLQRPTAFANNPGVTLATASTYPIGFYTNLNLDGAPKTVPDLPVLGALAQHYTVLDHYFCSLAGETFPNRSYQHATRTDRDHDSLKLSTLPTIWDQLSPIPNTFWHLHGPGDGDVLRIPVTTPKFFATVAAGELPNVSFVDPDFALADDGTGADDRPKADIRRGERFIADVYHAWPARATWTTPCWSSRSMSGAASSTTCGRPRWSTILMRLPSTTPGTASHPPTAS